METPRLTSQLLDTGHSNIDPDVQSVVSSMSVRASRGSRRRRTRGQDEYSAARQKVKRMVTLELNPSNVTRVDCFVNQIVDGKVMGEVRYHICKYVYITQ